MTADTPTLPAALAATATVAWDNILERAKQPQGQDQNQGQPDDRMYPVRWLVTYFDNQCGANNNKSDNQHDKDCWTVAGIRMHEIGTTCTARVVQLQIAAK